MFVRDGRTLPFVPVTVEALEALRAVCATPRAGDGPARRSYPHALATYMALLELANGRRTDRVAITQPDLAAHACASRSAIQRALGDLEEAGVLERREQVHGSGRIENEYVVIEPSKESAGSRLTEAVGVSEGSSPASARPSQPSAAQAKQPEERTKNGRAPATDDEHRTVSDLFEHWQLRCNHPTSKPTRERRQKIAARLREGYTPDQIRAAIDGAARAPFVSDEGKRFDDLELICRTGSKLESFIDRAAPPLAANGTVHPIRPPQGQARNANGKPTHAELIGELRAANPRLHPELAANHQLPART